MLEMGKLISSSYIHKSLLTDIFLLTLLIVLQMNRVLLVMYPEMAGWFLTKKASLLKAELMYRSNCQWKSHCWMFSGVSNILLHKQP